MKPRKVKTSLLRCPLRLSSGIVVFLLVGLAGIVSVPAGAFAAEDSTQKANQTAAVPKNAAEPVYSVVSPLGDSTVEMITMGPRLNTLEGKTVGMVWNHAFQADITFPAIEAVLKQKYPGIKIIPYTEIDAAMRAAGGVDFSETTSEDSSEAPSAAATLQKVLKEKGINALVSGNGG